MKKLLLPVLLSASSLFGAIYNLKPIHITPDIACVIGDFNPPTTANKGFVSNMCYVNMGDRLVVLDAGPTYRFAQEFHALMTKEYPNKKVTDVILTNYHDDRIQGASYFKSLGARIIGHKTINDDIKKNPGKFERMKRILPKEVFKGTQVIPADTLVGDGYTIKGSKKTLTILKPSPVSEERSDIAVYSPNDSFLFVGNMVFNGRMLNYTKHSNVDGWIAALEKLAKLKAKYVLGGHGAEYDANSYQKSLEYLKILQHDVKAAYDNDIDREEVKKHVRDGAFKGINYYDQLHHSNINHYYDQLEWAE